MQEIYEDLQSLLESRTEALARRIEQCVTAGAGGEDMRAAVLKCVDDVKINRRNLVSACEHGF